MRDAGSLAAVVVSVVDIERRPAAGRLLAAARRERPSVPRLVGGNAVSDEGLALDLGADGWVADPRGLGDLFRDVCIAARSDAGRRLPTIGVPGGMASTARADGDAMDRSGRGRWIGLAMLPIPTFVVPACIRRFVGAY